MITERCYEELEALLLLTGARRADASRRQDQLLAEGLETDQPAADAWGRIGQAYEDLQLWALQEIERRARVRMRDSGPAGFLPASRKN